MADRDGEELVKVTIRLPKELVKSGKAVAMALELDFQDLVRDAVMHHIQRKAHAEAIVSLAKGIIAVGDRARKGRK